MLKLEKTEIKMNNKKRIKQMFIILNIIILIFLIFVTIFLLHKKKYEDIPLEQGTKPSKKSLQEEYTLKKQELDSLNLQLASLENVYKKLIESKKSSDKKLKDAQKVIEIEDIQEQPQVHPQIQPQEQPQVQPQVQPQEQPQVQPQEQPQSQQQENQEIIRRKRLEYYDKKQKKESALKEDLIEKRKAKKLKTLDKKLSFIEKAEQECARRREQEEKRIIEQREEEKDNDAKEDVKSMLLLLEEIEIERALKLSLLIEKKNELKNFMELIIDEEDSQTETELDDPVLQMAIDESLKNSNNPN
ncbi:hypothetical protein NUSPORA_00373 [Nucleospora cyclopteri]